MVMREPLAQPGCDERRKRIVNTPGFVLHQYPYRETSLMLDIFSRDHGRLALIAKGAKRPHSTLRSVLQTFQPVTLSWRGQAEVRILTCAEWVGGMPPLNGAALLCGFYINELLIKFCAREDAHALLFDHYVLTLTRLAHGESPPQALRSFEYRLLREIGYIGAFDTTFDTREPIKAPRAYVFEPEHGVRDACRDDPPAWPIVVGQTLLDIERDEYECALTIRQSKTLLRFLLQHTLGGTLLNTQRVLLDLHKC